MKTSVKFPPTTAMCKVAAVDRRLAILLIAFILGWYTRTLPPGLLMGDPGEFQFSAWRFGLAHPTGYPLYLILGGIWQRLLALFGMEPASTLNLFSTVTGALTVGLLYLLMARWLPPTGWGRLSALFAALLLAFNPTFWSQSIIAEVYALHALLIVALLLAVQTADGGPQTADRRRQTADGRPQYPIPNTQYPFATSQSLITIPLLLGLALTHHRTSLFLLPGVILWLFWVDRNWWQRMRIWIIGLLGIGLPQLLYLYIPLRSGPDASPWLYPRLDGKVLALYQPGWQGFIEHITGSVFAVSLLGIDGALARLPQMTELWSIHFNATGLALMVIGLIALIYARRWSILLLTVPFALIHQIFNLFYGIGDIFVFYIPLYLMGAIWAGFGVWQVGQLWERGPQTADSRPQTANEPEHNPQYPIPGSRSPVPSPQLFLQFALFAAVLFFTIAPLARFFPEIDQSRNDMARAMWNAILAADPPADAILISNDRNEIVPLYYLQAVEGRAPGITGIFPLLTPEERFADVGAVIKTALDAGDRPVYLIKPMDELAVRFHMETGTAPLVHVTSAVDAIHLDDPLNLTFGPLTLLGYDRQGVGDTFDVTLFWQVNDPIDGDYTTTVQIFDAGSNRIGQSDQPPGHPFYPTSLWKAGDILRERHRLSLDGAAPARLLVAMYRRPAGANANLIYLTSPLEIELIGAVDPSGGDQ
jgi:hypothetical protein